MKSLVLAEDWAQVPELLTAARELGSSELAILSGEEVDLEVARDYGASSVIKTKLSKIPEEVARLLVKAVEELDPELVLASSSKNTREALARAAHRLSTSCANDCFSVERIEGGFRVVRPVLGGGYQATQELYGKPAFITLQPKRIEPKKAEVRGEPPISSLGGVELRERVKLIEVRPAERVGVDLESAEIIVSVGRGFKRREDLAMAEELAKLLGGELGCSRPISGDLKWLPEERHIGLSGKWVKPKLYIAVGISGQIQHIVGIRNARTIVAINNDPNAPIHKEADYSAIVDLYTLLPALIKRIKSARGINK